MSYIGLLMLGSTEILNQERVQAYINNLMPASGLRVLPDFDTIHYALGEEEYRTPLLDGAEWADPNNPASLGFYGLYALEVTGLDDSTQYAVTTESIGDGGTTGAPRYKTKVIRVHGYLVGADDLAVQAGKVWLQNAIIASSCGLHDDLCGTTDLRYFRAYPDVCTPRFYPTNSQGEVVHLGYVDAGTSPIALREEAPPERPLYADWLLDPLDGVRVEWGAFAYDSGETLEQHGPVYLRRSNFIVNPTFTTSANSWAESADAAPVTGPLRVVAGGRTFGRAGAAAADILTNWLPDPSFEHGDPETNGWRSITPGGLTEVADVTAPSAHVAVVAAVADRTEMDVTVLGPADPTVSTLSFYSALNTDDIVVALVSNAGVLLEEQTIPAGDLTGDWQRVSVTFTNPVRVGYVVRLTTAGTHELRVDEMMLTAGSLVDYFDGDTPTADGNIYSYPSGFSGPSRSYHDNGVTQIQLDSAVTDAPFGEVVLSFDMRADETSPTVTIELVDALGDVVANAVATPTSTWTRYTLLANFGRQVRARFISNQRFDLDAVLLEAGSTVLPYFDGSSVNPGSSYMTSWVGTPNASASRLDYVGNFLIERDEMFRPFLTVQQGAIPDAVVEVDWPIEIPMDDQLVPYDRYLHDVQTTQNVSKIADIRTSVGAIMEIDFVMTANKPRPLGPTVELFFDTDGTPDTQLIQDEALNLVPNASGEAASTGWVAVNGTSGTAAITNPVSATDYGTHVIRSTWSVASTAAGGGAYIDVPVVEGDPYSFEINHVKPSIANRLQLQVEWRTSSATISTVSGDATQFTSAQVLALSLVDQVAPATATIARLKVVSVAGTGYANWSVSSYLELDGAMTNFGLEPLGYFDGYTTDTDAYDYDFDGTTGLSTSRRSYHVATTNPLVDPDVPPIPDPPLPPTISNVAITPQNEWRRYYGEIPAANVATWANTIPTVQLSTLDVAAPQVRVRYYPNPFGWDAHDVDPTSYCAEFLLSYLPANSVLTVIGASERAVAAVAGGETVLANQLLYGTDGAPMTWPALSCGIPYLVTVDVPPTFDIEQLDVAISVNLQE